MENNLNTLIDDLEKSREKLEQLAKDRAVLDAQIAELIPETLTDKLSEKQAKLDEAKSLVSTNSNKVKNYVAESYNPTSFQKVKNQLTRGLTMTTGYHIDPVELVKWAIENNKPEILSINAKAAERLAKEITKEGKKLPEGMSSFAKVSIPITITEYNPSDYVPPANLSQEKPVETSVESSVGEAREISSNLPEEEPLPF